MAFLSAEQLVATHLDPSVATVFWLFLSEVGPWRDSQSQIGGTISFVQAPLAIRAITSDAVAVIVGIVVCEETPFSLHASMLRTATRDQQLFQ